MIMTDDEGYNGWSSRETWALAHGSTTTMGGGSASLR
jgi:hypothetical protein